MPDVSLSATEEYKRAFSLARYVLGDLKQAEDIALRVVSTNDKELKKQVKNRKAKKHPKWTRVLRNKAFNIDILTHIKSIEFERKQERAYWEKKQSLDDEGMIIRFIKQIVLDGLVRNSRFLNVGLGRLVFYYPYDEIVDIQHLLEQSSDGLPDEYRYRKHRQVLFDRLRRRFNDEEDPARHFLKLEPFNQHSEAIIVARSGSEKYYPLVRECLAVLIPPEPECPVYVYTLNPQTDVLTPFHFDPQAMDDGEEHAVERNRMHAVICPTCHNWILSALNLRAPDNSLRLPEFFLNDRGGGEGPTPQARRQDIQQAAAKSSSIDQPTGGATERGERLMVNKVVIAVDNVSRETIALADPRPIHFELGSNDSIVEVFDEGNQDGVPLGLIYLDWDMTCDEENPAQYKLKLNEQSSLEFSIFYRIDSVGNEEMAMIKVNCVTSAGTRRAYAQGG